MDFSPSIQPEFLAQREKTLKATADLSRAEQLILRHLLAKRGAMASLSEILLAAVGVFDGDAATFQVAEAIDHINAALAAAGAPARIVMNANGGARLVN